MEKHEQWNKSTGTTMRKIKWQPLLLGKLPIMVMATGQKINFFDLKMSASRTIEDQDSAFS
jgi:hypothetical protein